MGTCFHIMESIRCKKLVLGRDIVLEVQVCSIIA